MDHLRASDFVAVARAVSAAATEAGLPVPGFRSPPRTPGLDRALRRWPDGRTTVLVRRAGVPADVVVDAMVQGVLVAARVERARAAVLRPRLMAEAWGALDRPAPSAGLVAA